uniref:RNase H type-1 domain-containing protein n=1 Tax=Chenopodium quinoa TaxID=63459 RepID=A0A803LBG1_CHEQI
MFCDGSSNQRGAGLGVVLKSPQGELIVQSISCDFKATNNEADYEALITGKKIEQDLQDIGLNVFSDSLLIASQLNGEFAAKDSKMIAYLEKAKTLAKTFNPFTIKQIPRDKNTQANALANLGSALRKSPFSSIPLVHLTAPSIDAASTPDIMEITTEDNWTMPILKYLRDDALPDDPLEARKIRYKASRYTILHNVLFKMSSTGLLQRCLVGDEQWEALQEHHDEQNDEEIVTNLDSSEELREATFIRMAAQQQVVSRCFNKKVKAKFFRIGDWVLRRVFQNTKNPADGKLGPTWEDPYQIVDIAEHIKCSTLNAYESRSIGVVIKHWRQTWAITPVALTPDSALDASGLDARFLNSLDARFGLDASGLDARFLNGLDARFGLRRQIRP